MNKIERIAKKLTAEITETLKNIEIPIFVENDNEVVVSLYLPKKELPFLLLDYRYSIITNAAEWTDENFTNKEKLEILNAIMIAFEKTMEEKMKLDLNFTQEDFTNKINELILEGKDKGFSTKDISDKWHTFGDLYYHRMILTYIILKNYPSLSWKSKQHHDGTMFDDSFVVGINTPKGQYSYHYDLKYWDLFDIRELDKAPLYDGHKPEDIDRLISLL